MDDEVITQVLSGNTEAFRYFVKTYKDMAFNLAVSILKDESIAEEIVQDSFMKAFRGLKSFNRTAKFKTWFYRIVVNESYQKLRKAKKDIAVVDIDSVHVISHDRDSEEPSQNSINIEHAISLLPANEGLALTLFYLEDNSLKEMGEITGWTLSNTKVILHRARKSLRNKIEAKD